MNDAYPTPGATGGTLIRRVISLLKGAGLDLPITSYILIACSGGPDSIALAHLITKYGRRVVHPSRIRLLHVNHGWRGSESDADAEFVQQFARELGLDCELVDLRDQQPKAGESWEGHARALRAGVFRQLAKEHQASIFTAHHGDDLSETLLWRICTGSVETHGGGIALKHGPLIRPLLNTRKHELLTYLKEERLEYRVDRTNEEGQLLRSQMRKELIPVLEKIFPRAIEHLIRLGIAAQKKSVDEESRLSETAAELPQEALLSLFSAAGLKPRRAHWESFSEDAEVHLPGGWRLTQTKDEKRWILERLS